MKSKLTAANALILGGALVLVLGSFLPFYSVLGVTVSAWSAGLFGIATVIVFCGAAMGLHVALSTFGSRAITPKPFGLTWDQAHLALGFQAAIMMLAYLARERSPYLHLGTGFWMMLGGALALFVGALLRQLRPRRRRDLRSI